MLELLVVELYSHWGSGEYYGNPLQFTGVDVHPPSFIDVALKRGIKLGFIGSTDEHGGAPGDGITFYNPLGAGMACVWASDFSRESIFDALYDRYCYATTGARIILKFSVNGEFMGRTLTSQKNGKHRIIQVKVDAPDKIKEMVILKNNEEIAVKYCRKSSECWEWVDEAESDQATDYYYPRVVLQDGETAWGSPVWLNKY